MYRNLLFMAVGLVFAFTRCSKEDEREPDFNSNDVLIEWNDPYYSLLEDDREFMVVTDPSGKVLNWKEVTNGPNFTIYPSVNYDGKTINVYLVKKNAEYYNIIAILNIKRGSSWKPVLNSGPPIQGVVDLNIKNADPGFDYLTYGINWGQTVTSLADTSYLFQSKFDYYEQGQIYAQLVKDNVGYYEFFNIDPTKESFDIDYSSLKNLSSKKTIQLPGQATGQLRLLGKKVIDGKSHIYNLFERQFYGNSFDIFYPEVPTMEYSTSLYFRYEGRSFNYFYPGKLVTNIDLTEAEAEVVNPNPKQFKVSFSGDFDYYFTYFTVPTFERNLHVYTSKAVSEFNLPDFSKFLPFEEFKTDDLFIRELTLTDIERYEENEEFYNYHSNQTYYSSQPDPYSVKKQVTYINFNK